MTTMPSRKTLDEIALEAGVSPATVSRVFDKPDMVSERTKKRVLEASVRVGNGAPPAATLGLIVPDTSNPIFSSLLHALNRETFSNDYQLVVASSDSRPEVEMRVLERFRATGVAGVLYASYSGGSQGVLELASSGDIPILAYNAHVAYGNIDCIVTESRTSLQTMVDYFLNFGHENFAYISGPLNSQVSLSRLENLQIALSKNNLDPENITVFEGKYSYATGRDFAEQFLQLSEAERPTAILAASDVIAIGFMQRVQESGLRIPQDVSVAGFDGGDFGAWYSPSLTTITQPLRRMAKEGVRMISERISSTEKISPRVVNVDPRFIARDSVGPVASYHERRKGMRSVFS